MLFSNLPKANLNIFSKRFSRRKINLKAWPNDWVPFHWSRPESIPGYYDSGDLVNFGDPNPKDLHPNFRNSSELKKLDPEHPLRRMFSMDHAKVSHFTKAQGQEHMEKLGIIHEHDYNNSLEAQIINMTYALRHVHATIMGKEDSKYLGHRKMTANSIKYKRYSRLCDLKELHAERYERLIKALKIEPKNNEINVPFSRPYRKVQMRRIAQEYARDLKEKKVEQFIASLEEEKSLFEEEKKETLEWIEEQEKKLGITV